jgi:7-cyano-7-deazaguanine synthase in queuosine biosynthesis
MYLNGFEYKDFSLVGFSEHFSDFIKDFNYLINGTLSSEVKVREGLKQNLSSKEKKEATSILSKDFSIYNQFLTCYKGNK